MLQGIVEEHQLKLLRLVSLVVSLHQCLDSRSELIDVVNTLVDLGGSFFDLAFFVDFLKTKEVAEEDLFLWFELLQRTARSVGKTT